MKLKGKIEREIEVSDLGKSFCRVTCSYAEDGVCTMFHKHRKYSQDRKKEFHGYKRLPICIKTFGGKP